jgi:hypothetical protein
VCDKPILGRPGEHSKFHEQMLGDAMIHHTNAGELLFCLQNWSVICSSKMNAVKMNGYKQYTPEKVMNIFAEKIASIKKM